MIETFILAVATSTVCATLLNQGIVQFREFRGRRETGKLSALYAANELERYTEECSERLGDKENYISSNGHAGRDWSSLPELPEYPDEIDWKRLGIKFTEKMFAFRVDLSTAQNLVSSHYEFDPPDGGDHDVLEQLSKKGLQAVRLAREIRAVFGLTPTTVGGEYSSERYLIESKVRRDEKHRLFLEQQAQKRLVVNPQSQSEDRQ